MEAKGSAAMGRTGCRMLRSPMCSPDEALPGFHDVMDLGAEMPVSPRNCIKDFSFYPSSPSREVSGFT